jgi:hypothetical protein
MTVPFQTTGYINAVSAILYGLEQVSDIHSSGTRDIDDLDIAGIIKSHGTCQVRCGIGSKHATKSNNLWFKSFHDLLLF